MSQLNEITKPQEIIGLDFKTFLKKVFATLSPSEEFLDNWHIDYIIDMLQQVETYKMNRLAINLPPRSLKSIIISVAWPAWLMGLDQTKKIIVVSYSQALANKHSLDCRAIITSDWYKDLFPNTVICKTQNTKSKFVTDQFGFRFATSINSTLTGEGADIIIVDDPLTPLQATSQKERDKVNYWFESTLSSRLNNKIKGAIVLTMQRLHPNDLSGYLSAKGNWNFIKLPAVAIEEEVLNFGNTTILRNSGDLLHPNRENWACINQAKLELGATAFNAQYQQDPSSSQHAIFKEEWFNRYDTPPEYDEAEVFQSWDCAAKTHEMNDYSVCTTWQLHNEQLYLLDVFRERVDYPALKSNVISKYQHFKPRAVLIEEKMTGHALLQDLKINTFIPTIAIIPKQDKETRAISVSSIFESGRVHIPRHASFLADFEKELMSFPNYKHDDQVDSTTQLLYWLKNKAMFSPILKQLE